MMISEQDFDTSLAHLIEIVPGVMNAHVPECGVPPTINRSRPYGWFKNDYGEQGVMEFDLDTGVCRVWMGDCGWEREIRAEEFHGRLIVRYLKTSQEKDSDPEITEMLREACAQIYGTLTEEDFAIATSVFPIRPEEFKAIEKFYYANMKAFERLERRREKTRQVEEERAARKAEHDEQWAERKAVISRKISAQEARIERLIDAEELEEARESLRRLRKKLKEMK